MSKVKTNNEIALKENVNSFLPTAEQIDEIIAPESSAFLPYMEMVFPIMTDDIIYEGHTWEFGFRNGNEFEAFPEKTIFTVVDMRNAIKQTKPNEEGKLKNTYVYSKIVRNGRTFDKTVKQFEDMLEDAEDKNDKDTNLGVSMVVVALYEGKAVVLDFSAFKTVNGYMYPYLSAAKLNQGLGLRIDIKNHKCNLVKAKSSGRFYPSKNKFSQWEHVKLTKEQGKLALDALNAKADAYMAWLNK